MLLFSTFEKIESESLSEEIESNNAQSSWKLGYCTWKSDMVGDCVGVVEAVEGSSAEENSDVSVLTGDKSTNTKPFGLPGLFLGLLNGALFMFFPAAEILSELFMHSIELEESSEEWPLETLLFTLQSFLPLAGGNTFIL